MVRLQLHNRQVHSIFELLGARENDITYSIGWALSESPAFLQAVLSRLFPEVRASDVSDIRLQEYSKQSGITDVEISGPTLHVIVEAKRGWALPDTSQLEQYAVRLRDSGRPRHAMVVMSECSQEYARVHLPQSVAGSRLSYLSWKDVDGLSRITAGTYAERRLLGQLRTYLRRIVKMQNQESNLVYVVSLGAGTPEWCTIPWVDITFKKRRYFHPVGGKGGWPKDPPNYVGFRYEGKLQSIHHVESWKIVEDMHAEIPEITAGKWEPHFLYTLGDPIKPAKAVRTGKLYRSGRVWAMFDLLLTCDTISEACDITKRRLGET